MPKEMRLPMPLEIAWTQQAREDLLSIYILIGLEQPAAAERYYERIERKVRLLADQPSLGARRPDLRRGLRMLIEHPYIILYRTLPDADENSITGVQIVRIVDGRQDLPGLL